MDTGDNDTLDGGDAASLGSHTGGGCIVSCSGWQWQWHPTWWAHLVSVQSVHKLAHSPLAPHHPAQDVNGRQGKLRTALQHRDVPVGGEGRGGEGRGGLAGMGRGGERGGLAGVGREGGGEG